MKDKKFWAFDDRKAERSMNTPLENKLESWAEGLRMSLDEWRVYSESLRLRRSVRGYTNPI